MFTVNFNSSAVEDFLAPSFGHWNARTFILSAVAKWPKEKPLQHLKIFTHQQNDQQRFKIQTGMCQLKLCTSN